MSQFTHEQQTFLYDSYVKEKSKSYKRKFSYKYPGVYVLDSTLLSRLVKKVHMTGSFLDKKYIRKNAVLPEAT
jgi:hypothetical protein